MFKLRRITFGRERWTDQLFIEGNCIGMVGLENGNIFIKTNKKFNLKEINQLVAQITNNSPELSDKKIEFLPY